MIACGQCGYAAQQGGTCGYCGFFNPAPASPTGQHVAPPVHSNQLTPYAYPAAMRAPMPPAPVAYWASPPKSRVAYVVLAIFLGGLGIHNFYAGRTGAAVTQLLLMIFLSWTIVVAIAVWIWIIVEMFSVTSDGRGQRFS